jgi:GWxTD domain-containing protein
MDSLSQHIQYLQPIADQLEWEFAKNQLSSKDFTMMKRFFYNFWEKRNQIEPEYEWMDYLHMVHIVNKNYKTPMRPGYLSDRGYRYLKYGPPTNIYESFDEPQAYPYEIWFYAQVWNQSNKRIIFYNKSMVMNDYTILHSDINGEMYNKDWNMEINRQNPGVIDNERPAYRDHFGGKTDDWVTEPR